MKVGVVSDTHLPRFGDRLPERLRRGLGAERVELILHLGDFTGREVPAFLETLAPLEAVAGNNDPPALVRRFGRRKVVTLDGVRVGMVHGDGTRSTTAGRSVRAFEDDGVDVICFGHSHRAICERRDGIWLVQSRVTDGQADTGSLLLRDPRCPGGPRRAAARVLRSRGVRVVGWPVSAPRDGRGPPPGRVRCSTRRPGAATW